MTDQLFNQFQQVRAASEQFCEPLETEDYGLQAMPETSPPKWHLAHTTWFFETFLLKAFKPGYAPVNPAFEVLFNSYYNGIGEQHPRPERGLLSRPTLDEVRTYRRVVTQEVLSLLENSDHEHRQEIRSLVELGIHHEQQHQELFYTDIKYSLSRNPLGPALVERSLAPAEPAGEIRWIERDGGEVRCGHPGEGFSFDNEGPEHALLLQPHALADRLVTNAEFRDFIEDGGYQRPELWLADGWARVCEEGWERPLYWSASTGEVTEFTLHGPQALDPHRPVCHVSGYEADAYARWAGARLPTEFEWEASVDNGACPGQFLEGGELHPRGVDPSLSPQVHGYAWQWTSSAYAPYPGYTPAKGAVGEYNGKFMANQWVLRGGSCVTSHSHIRPTYRNFFYPPDRWQFSGIRLAKWR